MTGKSEKVLEIKKNKNKKYGGQMEHLRVK